MAQITFLKPLDLTVIKLHDIFALALPLEATFGLPVLAHHVTFGRIFVIIGDEA